MAFLLFLLKIFFHLIASDKIKLKYIAHKLVSPFNGQMRWFINMLVKESGDQLLPHSLTARICLFIKSGEI